MAGESNADVYASFGVNSAVITGDSVSAHEQNMLALDVAARDGDDAIELGEPTERDLYDNSDPFGQEDDEGRIQVRIGEDGQSVEEASQEAEAGGEQDGEPTEFTPLGDTPEALKAAQAQLAEHDAGFQEMISMAMERGLTAETIERIQAEYDSEAGISEKSYQELDEIGYTKGFIDSYIRGQEALVEQYVAGIVEYAGGREQFDALYQHLENTNPEASKALETALENLDVATVKAIINLAGESRSKTFGRKPTRSVTQRAVPAKPQAPKKVGFESRAEMVKAMSDVRYRTDSKYRAEVEQKVWNSNF